MSTYTPEQQAANRARWTVALRSGEFVQAAGALRGDEAGSYCCLGVACELAASDGLVEWIESVDDGYRKVGTNQTPKGDVLPDVVLDWLGLSDAAGVTLAVHRNDDDPDSSGIDNLAEINDDLKWSFDKIADLIEAGGVKLSEVKP